MQIKTTGMHPDNNNNKRSNQNQDWQSNKNNEGQLNRNKMEALDSQE